MLFLSLFVACQAPTNEPVEDTEAFDTVTELESQLTGRFDSSDQAAADSSFYAISLSMCTIETPDARPALYVEQAAIGSTPYRQRLYILSDVAGEENTVKSTVYSLKNEGDFVGYCDSDSVWSLSEEDYELREGCDVVLEWDGIGFNGGTVGNACATTLNGASYATSIVTTTPDTIESWDQGWFDNGVQAWGAVDGPYIFIRQ